MSILEIAGADYPKNYTQLQLADKAEMNMDCGTGFQLFKIRQMLLKHYNINVEFAERLSGGRASLFLCVTNVGKVVLKEYPKNISSDAIQNECDVCNYLVSHHFNVSHFIITRDGRYLYTEDGHYYTLQFYEEGTIFQNHCAPPWMEKVSATLLGKLHSILRSYKVCRTRFKPGWPSENDYRTAIIEHEKIINWSSLLPNELASEIISEMKMKINYLSALSRYPFDISEFSFNVSHGDYCLQQMIVRDQHDITIIDFTSVDLVPVAWELVRSFSFIDTTCKDAKMDLSSLNNYISQYEKTSGLTLSQFDKCNMLKIYAIQLMLSPGGYLEFFSLDEISKKNAFLSFGRWRTQLAANLLSYVT